MCIFRIFLFNDASTTEIYTYLHTLARHDALPISARGTASRAVTKSSIARRGVRFIVIVLSLGSRPARARDPKHIVNNRAERQLFPCRPDKGIGAKSKVDYSRERMSLRRWRAGPGGGCRGRRRSRRGRGRPRHGCAARSAPRPAALPARLE